MKWVCGPFEFDTGMPLVMGILNVTPDSFSDGGRYENLDAALAHAHEMLEQGARIIDVGGESTRPGHLDVSPDEELARVLPVVECLVAEGCCVSIDTRHAAVAQACLQAGAAVVNEVSGCADPAMRRVLAESSCGVVAVHPGFPVAESAAGQDDEPPAFFDAVAAVRDWMQQTASELEACGVAAERICVDPGPGFGKTARQTIDVVRNFQEFARLGYPLMAALSRKSYLQEVYGIEDPLQRDQVSAKEALTACELGAGVVRTHNVEATCAALRDLRPYVFVGLGCNVGVGCLPNSLDNTLAAKKENLARAVAALCALPDTFLVDMSSFYESEPAYVEDQPGFVNAAVLLRTGLPPKELLKYLNAVEEALGRERTVANGPRTCDLDILDYQRYVAETELLTLPHPRLLERDFTVKPLLELRARHVLADGSPVTAGGVCCGAAWRLA